MAIRSRFWFYLFLGALLPTFASCIRPFRVPKNLFVHGTSPFTLPEGARMIRREAEKPEFGSPQEPVRLRHARFRRDSSGAEPEKSFQSLAQGFDTLFMYWPRNSEKENFVFLLAKNTKGSGGPPSKVYLSKNYGKNFTELKLNATSGSGAVIDHIYSSKPNPKLCILADKQNKILYQSEDLETFKSKKFSFVPSYITFHPSNDRHVMAYDNTTETLYWSNDKGKTFTPVRGDKGIKVKTFFWGNETFNDGDTIFVEAFKSNRATTKDNTTTIYEVRNGQVTGGSLASNVEEFEIMKNYMFITTKKNPQDENPIMKVCKMVKGQKCFFTETQFPLNEKKRDFFVFDVVEDFVFVVINHERNLSNMYISDTKGIKYQLCLPRVLYHNPYTDVSSPWLRTVIPYAFVDVERIKGMRGIYVATQLTPGPVGKRHLLSLITYNRGAKWQRIRSPTVDIRGGRILCSPPSCSIHMNLLYGAVYRVSPSEPLFSSESAPGMVLALGVASTNLKIYPDLFMSLDGGYGWNRVLRGKYLFMFGDHGGVVIAVPYRRYTRSLRYSTDGGASWVPYNFSPFTVLARDVVTQPGERLPVFLIYGIRGNSGSGQSSTWMVFYLNMTAILGPVCKSSAYISWSDGCLLGRKQQLETRNWSIPCQMGRDYKRPVNLENCPCSRDDFQCDYGFQRKVFDEECRPIRQGVDLNNQLIPDNCPEGTNYSRTQGFRKIPGDTCVNGTEADFLPVSTPCPVEELSSLTVSCTNLNQNGTAVIETGKTASFRATVRQGNHQNINYRWFYGDGHNETGQGATFASRQHQYDKPGKYIVTVVASNTRSILVARVDLNVQEKLNDQRVTINFHPRSPHKNEAVIFSANLNYSNEEVGNVKYHWKYDDVHIMRTHPVAVLKFKKAKNYTVQITAENYVSALKKTVTIQVVLDLEILSASASVLSASSILVSWKPPEHADSFIKYYVFKSTSGNGGFQRSTCVAKTNTSCAVGRLTPATTYYFKVQAVSSQNDLGPFSQLAIATTNTSMPGPPENLKAHPLSPSSIQVQWNAPTNANGVTNYTIRWWSQQNPEVQIFENGLLLKKKFGDLNQDTYYFFEVYAKSKAGRSVVAGPVHALTQLSKPVLPPREIKKVSDNGSCAVLTWKAPYHSISDNRTFPAKGYKVTVNDVVSNVPGTFAIICKLQTGKVYTGKVLAYSEAGDGPTASFTVSTQSVKPGAPRNVRYVEVSENQVKLQWDAPAQSSSGITGYTVYQIDPPAEPNQVPENQRSYIVGGLKPHTTYKFSIAAKNSLGISVRSPVVKVTTLQSRPGVVKYVNAEVIQPKSASIKLTWSKPENLNGPITKYRIKWAKSFVGNKDPDLNKMKTVEVNGSVTAYTFNHLESSTSYSFVVTAKTDAGLGLRSVDPVSERTLPARKGTERLQLQYNGPRMDGQDIEDFKPKFIQAASQKAGILDVRLAALDVQEEDRLVMFDLLPPLSDSTKPGVPMKKAKSALNSGFSTPSWELSAGTLKRLYVYDGTGREISPSPAKPTIAAQRGAAENGGSSTNTQLAIAIPLALIGLALLFGMIFFYMKYKSLQKHVRNMADQNHEEDEMKVVYHEDMQADSPDVIFSDQTRKNRKVYRDSEKVPLGESDELAMI